jgi:hypothetical protein
MNRAMRISPTSGDQRVPWKGDELIAAAGHLFRTGFPNPSRVGCPASTELQAMVATVPHYEFPGILDHLSCCSPCFAEYECLLRKRRSLKIIKKSALGFFLLLTGSAAIWNYALRR